MINTSFVRPFVTAIFLSLISLFIPCRLCADDIESGIVKMSNQLSTAISKSSAKKVSVIDFSDLQGGSSELGRYLAEQLSVSLVNSSTGFTVLDRANLKSLLEEHKLTASGLVNPDNARKIGQFAGVDAIILGTITPFGGNVVVTAKAIATESSQVLAATSISILRSKDIDGLLQVQTVAPLANANAPTPAPVPIMPETDFIAPTSSNSFSNVLVELTSFRMARPRGAIAVLKITNRNKSSPIKIGLSSTTGGYFPFHQTCLVDEQGAIFNLVEASGIGIPHNSFTEIRTLQSEIVNWPYKAPEYNNNIVKLSDIDAGDSTLVTLQFQSSSGQPGELFRLQSELIVGVPGRSEQLKLSLNNVLISGIRPK